MQSIRLSKTQKTIRIVNREGQLRLSKDSKTIKVVNRKQDLKLQHTGKTGPVSTVPGPQGVSIAWQGEWQSGQTYAPTSVQIDAVEWEGSAYLSIAESTGIEPGTLAADGFWDLMVEKGDTGVSTFVRAHHGTDADLARPSAVYVEWVGSVAPNNATVEDTWIHVP